MKKSDSIFNVTHKDKSTSARIGIIRTKSGTVETPFFMPVATKASVRFISTEDLESMGAKAIISNMLVLHTTPGEKLIKKMGGLGKFMNYKGINVTDSGGFQMYSDRIYKRSNSKGVYFINTESQEEIFMTPERDMEIQLDIDSDIAMCLDSMPLMDQSKEQVAGAVDKTIMWAKRCKDHHDNLQGKLPQDRKQLLWGIIQGGLHNDLRKKCATAMIKMDFPGYSIGELALGEPKESEYKVVKFTKKLIPENKPVYLMGVGSPDEIVEAIADGVDMFDSRFPTQNARHGTIFTSEGKIKIKNSQYKEDKKPIDSNCHCFVCKNYTRAYIRYQLRNQESVGMRLATYHNLFYMQSLINQSKEAIKKGTFKQFKEKIQKMYS